MIEKLKVHLFKNSSKRRMAHLQHVANMELYKPKLKILLTNNVVLT